MKTIRKTLGMTLLALALASLPTRAAFRLHRGVNISHWLSQSDARGEARRQYFTEDDVAYIAYIASLGFDHLRIPIDEEQMFSPEGEKDPEAFALLHDALRWCRKHGMRAVVDLHILRSHHFNAERRPLFTETAAQEKFYECWRQISGELHRYSNRWVAYELMNEPVADEAEQWNLVVNRCLSVVRELEPRRTVIIGSNRWQSYETVHELRLPEDDRHLVLSFHYYLPFPLTHFRASWTDQRHYTGGVTYPGVLTPKEELDALPEAMRKRFGWEMSQVWDRQVIASHFDRVMDYARAHRLQVYCGEYGCIDEAPEASRNRWLSDMDDLFEERGIGRALWDYKGGFGIIKRGQPDTSMIRILTGKERFR